MATEAISCIGEPIDVVVLNIHIVRLPSQYICLSPQMHATLNTGQKNFLFQWLIQRLRTDQNAETKY